MGVRMRGWISAGLIAAALGPVVPAHAERVTFSPRAFQVFGAIDDSAPEAASWNRPDVPESLRSRKVSLSSPLPPGSILVKTGKRRLYYILPEGQAIEYHVGVGREGFTWSGEDIVSRKAEWPDWRPPQEMIEREARRGRRLPAFMPGGPGNPLGARAIYIGNTQFRIHGTNQPWSIGQAVSSGCIRMMNEEVIDLYERVAVGARVVVED